MKKQIFLALAIFLLGILPSHSQERHASASGRAARITEWMKTNLQLTPGQLPQVTEINLKYANQAEELRKSSGDKKKKMHALKAADAEKDKELKALLTETQFATYLSKKEELKQKMKEKMKEGKG